MQRSGLAPLQRRGEKGEKGKMGGWSLIKQRAYITLRAPLLLIVGTCVVYAYELFDPSCSMDCVVYSNVLILL